MDTESSYVVSMTEPLAEAEAFDVAEKVAPRLGVSRDRFASLLSRGAGAITRPLEHDAASRIAAILESAGVKARVESVTDAAALPKRPIPPVEKWVEFEPTEGDEEMLSLEWKTGTDRSTPTRTVRAVDDAGSNPDEGPMFDWNQPLGSARWRRPVLLVALLVALGAFALLQASTSSRVSADDTAGAFERGLDMYRVGAFQRALRIWDEAAATGDRRALYMLGYMSEFGQGQEWSNRRAAEYYRQAAERGSAPAQFALASLYERGLGVPISDRTAVRWYRVAAQNGHAEAQYRVALASLQGRGTERDYAAALEWFEKASANGIRDADAFTNLLRTVPREPELSAESTP